MRIRDWCLPLFLLGVFLFGFSVVGSLFLGDKAAKKLEEKISSAVESSLTSQGYNWANVTTSGQKVTLSGLAPSEQMKLNAIGTATTAIGGGGIIFGGVTRLIDKLQVGEIISPYVLGANVEGNTLTLTGFIPSAEAKAKILQATEGRSWSIVKDETRLGLGVDDETRWTDFAILGIAQLDGLKPGSIAFTDNHLRIDGAADNNGKVEEIATVLSKLSAPYVVTSHVIGPYSWVAEKSYDTLRLSGLAPDEESRNAIVSAVSKDFSGTVVDEMGIGGESGWVRTALIALPHFAKFESGQLSYSDNTFFIKGKSPDSVYNYLSADMNDRAGSFGVQYDIDLSAPELNELNGLNLRNDGENVAAVCQDAFALIMDANQIYFDTASTELSRRSGSTLDKLVAVAMRCKDVSIRIEGHTDNIGKDASNLVLSNERAQSVAKYLISRGMSSDRISSVGYGATKPASSNTTAEGRAANRRIEFLVTSEETR